MPIDEVTQKILRVAVSTLPPAYPRPSFWWQGETRRARIFHRDYPGQVILEISGPNSSVDAIATAIAQMGAA